MGELLTPTHLMVLGVVAFVVFGGRKLPELGRGLVMACAALQTDSRE